MKLQRIKMKQKNWEGCDQDDEIKLLKQLITSGIWEHDKQDENGCAHLKEGIIGTGETISINNGTMGFSTWQNIFSSKFDGPRQKRNYVLTIAKSVKNKVAILEIFSINPYLTFSTSFLLFFPLQFFEVLFLRFF